MKICPVRAESFHRDRQTDGREKDRRTDGRTEKHNEVRVTFPNFTKAAKTGMQ